MQISVILRVLKKYIITRKLAYKQSSSNLFLYTFQIYLINSYSRSQTVEAVIYEKLLISNGKE